MFVCFYVYTYNTSDPTRGTVTDTRFGVDYKYAFLRGVEWVHGLFLFPLVLGKM